MVHPMSERVQGGGKGGVLGYYRGVGEKRKSTNKVQGQEASYLNRCNPSPSFLLVEALAFSERSQQKPTHGRLSPIIPYVPCVDLIG